MARPRKTRTVYVLRVNYGQGFEDELEVDTKAEVLDHLKTYRANCPQYPASWLTRRERV